MALYINKAFNVCGAWDKLQSQAWPSCFEMYV